MVLPVIFLSMAVLLTVFFVCLSAISENSKIHIGVVVPEKGFMERGLLEYVSNMADTKTLCEFRELSETEAKEQLDEGKVAAYVTLPENLLEKIYRNEKTSVHMTTAKTPTIESALMEELVDSAVSFVLTAKAGDYAAYQLYAKYGRQGSMKTVAKEQLDEGKVAAYVTLPENLLEKIYRNEKTSVHMTTAKTPTIESALMEELVDSAVSFVLTAKAGDYAAYQLYAKYGRQGSMKTVAMDMNRNYIRFILRQETLFHEKTIKSASGMNDTTRIFLGIMVTLLTLMGAILISLRERPTALLLGLLKGKKINPVDTLFFDVLLNGGVLFLCMTAGFYGFAALLGVKVTMLNMCGIVFGSFCAACLLACVVPCGRANAGQILFLFVFAVVQFVLLGGAFPDYMLPKILVSIGKILPGGVFVDLLHAEMKGQIFSSSLIYVLMYGVCFFCLALWRMKRKRGGIA